MRGKLLAPVCAAVFPLALLLPTGLGASASSLAASHCAAAGYGKSLVKCQIVPLHGRFSIPISHSSDKLLGTGSRSTHGTQITVIRVPAPVASRGGYGIRVRSTGKFNPLHLTKGKLYRYHPARNTLGAVKAVTSSGVFQVV